MEREARDVQTALALLRRLEKSLQKLPQRATQAQWTDALCALAEEIGLVKAIGQGDAELVQRDQAAWNSLVEALRDGAELFTQLGEQPPLFSASDFLGLVIDLLRWQHVTTAKEEVGRVRVLSANSVRALSVPYLFFGGLSEKAFPTPERHDRLYSEGECRRLREQQLPFPLRDERNQDEMLLFYEVVTRATRRLFLSYPALDEKAEPLLPSPYLREVERACGEDRIRHTRALELSPVPSQGDLQSQRDFRVHAVDRALEGDLDLLAGLPTNGAGGLRHSVLDGMSLVAHRAGREFGRFDGVFADAAAQAALAKNFGPQRRWTVSHLEHYASCPHRFFLEKVLGLEPLDELTLETDHLERGSLLHELLHELHQRLNEELGAPTSPAECNPRQFEDELAAVAQRVLQTGAEHPVQAALREIERRLLLQWAADYRRQHEQYDQRSAGFEHPLRPAHFEVSFGLEPPSPDPLSTLKPLELSHSGENVLLCGRIDRIDVGERGEQAVFNIIDYKSGRPRGDRDQDPDGTQMQLELYALAVEQLLLAEQGIKPLSAGYWHVRNEGYRLWQEFHEATPEGLTPQAAWAERKDRLLERLFALVRGIRRGEFPMFSVDERCTSYCPFKTVCRVNHARALEKTWQPEERRVESGERRARKAESGEQRAKKRD
jgi:ATP-dependent helicase/DNAse subunit B